MGWFSTAMALKFGRGPYGTVKQSLKGEIDPRRTLLVALEAVEFEVVNGHYCPDKPAVFRLVYWSRKIGRPITLRANDSGA